MPTLKQKPDNTGCEHFQFNGPVRTQGGFEYGLCAECKNQIVARLAQSGQRTGEFWIVETSD
jgi:hypothetical protein